MECEECGYPLDENDECIYAAMDETEGIEHGTAHA
jgi:hypothetical protein